MLEWFVWRDSYNSFNFLFFSLQDEISRQLLNSEAQVIFGLSSMSKVLEDAVSLTKKSIRIIYVKESQSEALPVGGVDFNELINFKGLI